MFYVILNERESLSHIKNFTAMISLCIPHELFKLNGFFKLEEYPLLIDVIMPPLTLRPVLNLLPTI